MATPTLNIKTAARKLPIKRKTPPQSSSQTLSLTDPNPNPNPNPSSPDLSAPGSVESSIVTPPADNGYEEGEEYDEEDEELEDEEDDGGGGEGGMIVVAGSSSGADLKPPPFKFHRIWSEPDEIRFLQGLLGCWSQGMVFPRDLNLFYDRFSESMPQPYTRSQLSEKLRRLRKKFRIMSSRIARGQDPSRLAPHDRDLLHLCTRLWHPSYASSSPFTTPDAAAAGSTGNKRRRPNPRIPTGRSRGVVVGASPPASSPPALEAPPPPALPALPPPAILAPPPPPPLPLNGRNLAVVGSHHSGCEEDEKPTLHAPSVAPKGEQSRYLAAKAVLDVFDGSLKELRTTLACHSAEQSLDDLSKRWQEQRVAELDVFARRLRLVLEQSLQS